MQDGEYQPGSKWLFIILIIGDMIHTFALEVIAAISPSPNARAIASIAAHIVIGITFTIVPAGIFFGCQCCCEATPRTTATATAQANWCTAYVKPVLIVSYDFVGPILYYYGDNVVKVVNLIGDSFAFDCSDDCRRWLRISGVAALFLLLLFHKIDSDWRTNHDPKHWWEPATDMIVKIVAVDVLYTTSIRAAQSNMIDLYTSNMFCGGVDRVFFAAAYIIAISHAGYSILHSYSKVLQLILHIEQSDSIKCIVGVCGFVIWVTFVVHFFADNFLPLNFSLCNVPADDMAEVTQRLHIARAVLSIICALLTTCIALYFAVSAYKEFNFKIKCRRRNAENNIYSD